jgi:hypothetical protein
MTIQQSPASVTDAVIDQLLKDLEALQANPTPTDSRIDQLLTELAELDS